MGRKQSQRTYLKTTMCGETEGGEGQQKTVVLEDKLKMSIPFHISNVVRDLMSDLFVYFSIYSGGKLQSDPSERRNTAFWKSVLSKCCDDVILTKENNREINIINISKMKVN